MSQGEQGVSARAPLGLGMAMLVISGSAILAREAGADALAIAFWRTAAGAAIFLPLLGLQRARSRAAAANVSAHPVMLAASGVMLAAHFGLWLGSLELTTVASSVTLLSMSPVFVGVLSSMLLGEPVSRLGWVGLATAILGGAVIAFADGVGGDASNALLGDVMAFASGAAIAGYVLIGRALRRRGVTNLAFAGPTYLVSAALLGLSAAASGVGLWGFSTRTWIVLGLIALGPQLIGHGTLTWALGRLSAGAVSIAILFEPVGATLLAWVVLDELPVALFWVGAPVVLIGLGLAAFGEASATRGERV